jgi:GTP-binding protein HflX
MTDRFKGSGRTFLVGAELPGHPGVLDIESSLLELADLADTAGLEVVGQTYQRLGQIDPGRLLGKGKLDEIKMWVRELNADTVVFDDELSPRHQRGLEQFVGPEVRVVDRTVLIVDIFAQHARSREGMLQIMLAQYEYRLPRLTRQWTHLARQAGGGVARGGAGGVGLRGPGETQLETDRREINRRIVRLKRDLARVTKHRRSYRQRRRKAGIPIVSLVGYTNAGKSTLLNRLSGAEAYVADQLFATLDPTSRKIDLDTCDAILTDTVGFIQKLPAQLIAAFRSTLEEISDASLLLHVVDVSDPQCKAYCETVEGTLAQLGLHGMPTIVVLNKIDVESSRFYLKSVTDIYPNAVSVSARSGAGIGALMEQIEASLSGIGHHMHLMFGPLDMAIMSRLYTTAVIQSVTYDQDQVIIDASVPTQYVTQFEAYLIEDSAA